MFAPWGPNSFLAEGSDLMSCAFSMGRLRIVTFLAVVMTLTAVAPKASAVLLVYDPFNIGLGPGDYLTGDENSGVNVLGGQNLVPSPTPFYAGGWIQSGGDAQAVVYPGGGNLSRMNYPRFENFGGLVTDAVQFGCCSFGRDGRELANPLGIAGPQTLYQSFLVDFGVQGTDDPAAFGFRGVEWWNGGMGDSFLAAQLFVNSFSGVNDLTLQVTSNSGTIAAPLNGGGLDLDTLDGVHLVVMKFELNPVAPDVISVYLDPADSIESNWTTAASLAVNASDWEMTHHGVGTSFSFSGPGHRPVKFDELRWGTTFADVTPFVPEPSTVSLVVVGAAGGLVVAWRRRRR
jgi:hypothetical protein